MKTDDLYEGTRVYLSDAAEESEKSSERTRGASVMTFDRHRGREEWRADHAQVGLTIP